MIPLNDFKRQWLDTRQRMMDVFDSVGESGWYILGARVAEFEAKLAGTWGMRYAAGVASGMDALEIALRILDCKRGDKVLTTPLSAFASTLAILKLDAVPVFVDTDEFGLIDLDACRRTLKVRPDIRFLLPVHLYGNAVDINQLRDLQDEFGISIVEDCAQSVGSMFDGQPTGTAGKLAATSFYPTKNLGAMGDGGAILCNDSAFHEKAKQLRDYGQIGKYQHHCVGYNSRLDELQAALLTAVYLPLLDQWTARRREIARHYLDQIQHAGIHCLGSPQRATSCWHLFPVLVGPHDKERFMAYLQANGIGCGEHYPILIPCQRALIDREFEVIGDCGTADRIRRSEVSIPIHPYLTDEEVDHIISVCNGWKD